MMQHMSLIPFFHVSESRIFRLYYLHGYPIRLYEGISGHFLEEMKDNKEAAILVCVDYEELEVTKRRLSSFTNTFLFGKVWMNPESKPYIWMNLSKMYMESIIIMAETCWW